MRNGKTDWNECVELTQRMECGNAVTDEQAGMQYGEKGGDAFTLLDELVSIGFYLIILISYYSCLFIRGF